MRMPTTHAWATATISRPHPAQACCARDWVRSICSPCLMAKRSSTTACASRCIRRDTCSGRRRFESNLRDACGSRRATTSSCKGSMEAGSMEARSLEQATSIRPARHSSRCVATCSSPNRPSACRSIDGSRSAKSSRVSMRGGGPTPTTIAHRCCSATRSARRSACSRESMRRSVPSSATAPSSRSTAPIAQQASRCRRRRWFPKSKTRRSSGRASCSRRLRPRDRRGCDVSANTAMGSRRAGCCCAAPGAGAGSIAASFYRITPIGRVCTRRSPQAARSASSSRMET